MNLSEKQCQCPTCDRVFSTERNFDLHRVGSWGDRSCADPEEVGMEPRQRVDGSVVYVRAFLGKEGALWEGR